MGIKQTNYNHALWNAINRIAEQNVESCSGLAICCGLDSTAFNSSKRQSKYGQPRWLSSETIAKILHGTNMTLTQFAEIVDSLTARHRIRSPNKLQIILQNNDKRIVNAKSKKDIHRVWPGF